MNHFGSLPLPNLSVNRFRGLKELKIPRFGNVTLLTGKNGVGKTTILEAARLWAARGASRPIVELLLNRGEITINEHGKIEQYASSFINTLFWGRNPAMDEAFTISVYSDNQDYSLQFRLYSKGTQFVDTIVDRLSTYVDTVTLERSFSGYNTLINWAPNPVDSGIIDQSGKIPKELPCVYFGPDALEQKVLVDFRDRMALTEEEDFVVSALNAGLELNIDRIAVAGEGSGIQLRVKIANSKASVPLASLGDGAMRLFGIALSMACSRNGLFLIDDIGNGVHYTIQKKLWNMICRTTLDYNVQVIATTHSYDSVLGFANAALNNEKMDGVVVRIEDVCGGIGVTTMDEFDLSVIAENGLEIR